MSVQLHTYVAKAAPTTGLRGGPKERVEGLLRVAFASTEAEILKETAAGEEMEMEMEMETEKEIKTTATTITTADDGEEEATEKEGAGTEEEEAGDNESSGISVSARQQQDGTTVTACLLVGNLLVTANVGDSTAVLGSMG